MKTITANTDAITKEVIDGKPYYSTVRRGVSYCAYQTNADWFVSSRRISLGRWNVGSGRRLI